MCIRDRGSPHLYRDLPDLGVDVIGEPLQVSHDPANQQLFEPVREPVGEKIHKPSLEQTRQQGDQRGAQKDNASSGHKLFYPQLGVKLCSMAGGGVQKIYMVFFKRTVPAGQVRQ